MKTNIFIKYETAQKTDKFRRALFQMRGKQCECCKNTHWLNQEINLELHHKDGDKSNNELDNLELLCPNCHSYTENYGSKNIRHAEISDKDLVQALRTHSTVRQALFAVGLSDAGANYNRARVLVNQYNIILPQEPVNPKEKYCIDCGKVICLESERCVECQGKTRQIFTITREELKNLIRIKPFTQIAKMYGVSDNAIRKRCDSYNLPRKSSDIKQISDEEWVNI
jgi:hypothetical protein